MKGIFKNILKGSAVITASRLVLKVFSGIAYFLILRQLSVAEYGVVSLALSLSGPALAVCGFGLDDLLVAQGARARGEGRLVAFLPTLRGFAVTKAVMVTLVLSAIFFAQPLFGERYQDVLRTFLLPLLVWVAGNVLRILIDDVLQLYERFPMMARANILETFSRMVCIFILFVLHQITVPLVIWSYVVGKLFGVAYASPVLRMLGRGSIRTALQDFFAFFFGQGKWEVLRNFIGTFLGGVDQWMIGFMLGVQAVGVYSFASTMNSLLSQALPFRQVLFPILSRLSSQARESSFVSRRIVKYSFWFNAIVIAVAMAGAPLVIGWFAPQFVPALFVFDILALNQLMSALSTGHGTLFYALREQRFFFVLSTMGTISAFTILPLFIWLMGVTGAVIENHLSTAVIIWLRERRLRRHHGITTFTFRDLWTFDAFDRSVVRRLWTAVRNRTADV